MDTQDKPPTLDILHKLLPRWLRSTFTPLFQCIYLPCFRFSSAGEPDKQIHMAYFGMSRSRAGVWATRICGEHYVEAPQVRRIWHWNIEAYTKKEFPDCNLVLLETCTLTERLLARKPGFKIPMWIQFAIDTTQSMEQLKRVSERLRFEIPRTIRKNSLEVEICRDEIKLASLIEEMHFPYVKGRHQENAYIPKWEAIERTFKNSDMVFIARAGENIAGMMLHYRNNNASLHYPGVKHNKIEYLKTGCVGALYYFCILRSIEKGMHALHMGGTSPFLTDSLTFFKLSFRPSVIPNTFLPDFFVKLSLRKKTPQLLEFLQKNPFISMDNDGRYYRNVYVDASQIQSVADFDNVFKKIGCGNIHATRVYVQGNLDAIRECLNESRVQSDTWILPY